MNKSHITTTAAILFAVATAGVGLANAQGFGRTSTENTGGTSPMHEQRGAFNAGLEATDYTSFVTAVGEDAPILDTITADNFDTFLEMRTLLQNGDKEGAKAIADSLGLPERGPMGDHKGMNKPQLTEEQHTAVEAALEAGDYSAFITAHGADSKIAEFMTAERFAEMSAKHADMEAHKAQVDAAIDARDYDAFVTAIGTDNKKFEQINETNFAQFAELHDLREAGDMEAAKALAEELGLQHPDRGEGAPGQRGDNKGMRGGSQR